jgi:uncharacterized membrane protein YphA (DoxX/SURF4 family)
VFENNLIELTARWILGLTFIYASYHKILAPGDFAKIVYGYGLFPHAVINLIAIILPFIEFVAGLALILGIYPRSAVLIINAMLIAFCFSAKDAGYFSSAESTLVRDIIYLLLGLQIFLFSGIRKGCFGPFSKSYAS